MKTRQITQGLVGAAAGLGVCALVIWQASSAAFTGTTENGVNIFDAATITLSDDDTNSVMFDTGVTPLVPGDAQERCITVEYTGTSFDLDPVVLYGDLPVNTDDFGAQLDLVVQEGTGGNFGDCTGFVSSSTLYSGTLSDFAATHSDYGSGVTAFTPSSGDVSRTYRFSVTLGTDTPDTSQGDGATATFTWEIQSA